MTGMTNENTFSKTNLCPYMQNINLDDNDKICDFCDSHDTSQKCNMLRRKTLMFKLNKKSNISQACLI